MTHQKTKIKNIYDIRRFSQGFVLLALCLAIGVQIVFHTGDGGDFYPAIFVTCAIGFFTSIMSAIKAKSREKLLYTFYALVCLWLSYTVFFGLFAGML